MIHSINCAKNMIRYHQGRNMNGRTPYKAFVDGLPKTKREEVKKVKKAA